VWNKEKIYSMGLLLASVLSLIAGLKFELRVSGMPEVMGEVVKSIRTMFMVFSVLFALSGAFLLFYKGGPSKLEELEERVERVENQLKILLEKNREEKITKYTRENTKKEREKDTK